MSLAVSQSEKIFCNLLFFARSAWLEHKKLLLLQLFVSLINTNYKAALDLWMHWLEQKIIILIKFIQALWKISFVEYLHFFAQQRF